LVKPRDPENLAQAMERFLRITDSERKGMGKKGREIALEKYDVKKVVEIYLREIETILNK